MGRAPWTRGFGTGDEGQLLLLAGIVLILGFVVTAFTLAQVADVEKQAAKEQESSFLLEYRFLHERLGSIMDGNTGRQIDNASFNLTLNTTAVNFRSTMSVKGYDLVIALAGSTSLLGDVECRYLWAKVGGGGVPTARTPCPTSGDPWDYVWNEPAVGADGPLRQPYDGVSDGILWMCDRTRGTAVGAVIHIAMSDGRTSVSETVVYAFNQPFYKAQMALPEDDRCK